MRGREGGKGRKQRGVKRRNRMCFDVKLRSWGCDGGVN
jgi:hypothetical protein